MHGDFRLGPWLVRPSLNTISSADASKRLEPKIMQVLVCLAEHASEVVLKEQLMAAVWPGLFVTDDALLRCISEARKALGDDTREPRFIKTIPKKGYQLIAEIKPAEERATLNQETPSPAILRPPWILAAGFLVLALLTVAGYVGWRWYREASDPSRTKAMLLVLPFQNLSSNPEQEYLSDGITEEMIAQLAQFPYERIGVIAPTTALQYKATGKRMDQIGRELGVHFVIDGAAGVENDRLRMTVRLVRVADQARLWAGDYTRDLSGIPTLKSEIMQEIAARIGLVQGRSDKIGQGVTVGSVNPEAYVAYLKGVYSRNRFTPQDLEAAIQHFDRAVKLDPTFARAWLGMADSYRLLGSWWGDMAPQEAFPIAKDAADRALELDPTLGEAHTACGWIRFIYDWKWVEAESELKRGIALSPNASIPHRAYANFLRAMSRFQEAHRELQLGLEVDPLSALGVGEAAFNCLEVGEGKQAEDLIVRLVDLDRNHSQRSWGLASFYRATGKPEKAIEILQEAARSPRPAPINLVILGAAYADAGKSEEARQVLELLFKMPTPSEAAIAALYLNLLDNERAIQSYLKAFEKRDSLMVWLRTTPQQHPIWRDPRFQELCNGPRFFPCQERIFLRLGSGWMEVNVQVLPITV